MSVFIIDPLRTECLVLHNQHFPIAGVFFFTPNCHSAKLGFCTVLIRELTSHVPNSPSVRGSRELACARSALPVGSFLGLGARLRLGSREEILRVVMGGGSDRGSWAQECQLLTHPLCMQQGRPRPPQQLPGGWPTLAWGCSKPQTLGREQKTLLPFWCFLRVLLSTFNDPLVWGL